MINLFFQILFKNPFYLNALQSLISKILVFKQSDIQYQYIHIQLCMFTITKTLKNQTNNIKYSMSIINCYKREIQIETGHLKCQ